MISDTLTFFLAFAALFAGIGAYLWILDGRARILEDRVAALELDANAANPKSAAAEVDSVHEP